MSLYLGPIHYWLYHKIRILVEREQLLWESAAQIDADMVEEGREMVWQTYGAPLPDEDLAELIDADNIHGWLQRQINLAELREAAAVRELLSRFGSAGQDMIKDVFAVQGKLCGLAARKDGQEDTDAAAAYAAFAGNVLNGMPCDRWDRLEQEDCKLTRWSNAGWIQAANWEKAGTDSQFLAQCHEVWHTEFFKALAPQLQYTMDIQGDLISRQVTA
nr:hypothetical protein [uncultured Anaeromusa sp.]